MDETEEAFTALVVEALADALAVGEAVLPEMAPAAVDASSTLADGASTLLEA